MTDIPSELGEMDNEDHFAYSPTERKIITQAYDLSLKTLLEQWQASVLILPETQRQYVWDNGRASRLIESLILNIPIPVLYFAETEDAKYEIIDGHQRVRSIVRYLSNEFSLSSLWVLDEYQRMRFHQLPEKEQRFLTMRIVRAVIISKDSHPLMKFEIFERLNSGSIILNSQEMRNSIYRGSFNRLLRDLVKLPTFRSVIGTQEPRRRMVDEELILRFLAFRARYDNYRAPLKRFLNEYMDSVRNASENDLATFSQSFDLTIQRINTLFAASAFRVTDEAGNPIETFLNRALFDAQMLATSWLDEQNILDRRPHLLQELATLYRSQDFLDSIQKATGNTSKIRFRIRNTVDAFRRAGYSLTVPYDLTN